MTSEVFQYGKYSCTYKIVRENRKHVRLAVRPDQSIVLKCPTHANQEQIDRFLKRKWVWINKQIRYFQKFCREYSPKEYVSGESFLYLGRQYQLIVRTAGQNSVGMVPGKIVVQIKSATKTPNIVAQLVNNWFRERSQMVFKERLLEIMKRFDVTEPPRLLVKSMEKRWGSFVRGKTIILNPKLISASKDCIDYVITHELCHFAERSHNKRFFRILDKKYPGWEKIKDKLESRIGGGVGMDI